MVGRDHLTPTPTLTLTLTLTLILTRSGAIIAGQFFLYDIFKGAFKVTAADLTQFLDMFSALGSASTTP